MGLVPGGAPSRKGAPRLVTLLIDPDVPLDLGACVAAVYERGVGAAQIDDRQPPPPPPLTSDDARRTAALLGSA